MKRHSLTIVLCIASVIAANAQYIKTIAGIGYTTGYTGDGGPATSATIYSPTDMAFDATGNLYITDFINNVIRKVDTAGIISTVAGTGFGAGMAGAGGYSGDGGPALSANLNGPFALAIDASGNIIFADGYNHVVRKVSTTGIITTIAGKITAGFSGDGGPATDAELNNPVGIAIDKTGNIYIADNHNNVVRMINTSGIITTIAGNTIADYLGDGGPATAASLNLPIGVALDTADNLYLADVRNNVIRRVDKITGIITTVAGADSAGYTGDGGLATLARIDSPHRINFDDSNHMYISDFFNNVVRKVDAATQIITTIAGNGYGAGTNGLVHDFCGEDSLATAACLYLPFGVAFNRQKKMHICDRGNHTIRRIAAPPPVDHTGTGIDLRPDAAFTMYPNPSAGAFTINITSPTSATINIIVTNVLGKKVYEGSAITNTPYTLMLNETPGTYLLTVYTPESRWYRLLVIQ